MCFATQDAPNSRSQESGWKLEKKGEAWQLKVETEKLPSVVDVSPCGGQLEIELSRGAKPLVVRVPSDAQPLEMARTKCTYSKKRSQLIVEWCQDALRRLERVGSSVDEVESAVAAHISAFADGSLALGKARDELAQLEARIEKLQCKGVDSVEISDSTEDKQAAKAMRKELTRRLESLQLKVEAAFRDMAAKPAAEPETLSVERVEVEEQQEEEEANEEERASDSDSSGVLVEVAEASVVVEEEGAAACVQEADERKEVSSSEGEGEWEMLSTSNKLEEVEEQPQAEEQVQPVEQAQPVEEVQLAEEVPAVEEVQPAEEVPPVEEVQPEEPEEQKTAEECKALGNEAVKAGDHAAALEHYSAGLRVEPSHAILLSNRALCLHKLERLEEALVDAKQCTVLRPEFHKGFLRAAMVLKELDRCQEAFEVLRRSPAHAEIEKFAAELRPLADAEEEKRIASLSGAEKRKEEANALFKKGLVEQALVAYGDALKMCETETCEVALAIRNNRANCYQQLSNFEGVVQETSFVLEHQPDNLKALIRRMIALEPLEKYERSLEDARRILRHVPGHEVANRMQHRLGKLVRDRQREREQGL